MKDRKMELPIEAIAAPNAKWWRRLLFAEIRRSGKQLGQGIRNAGLCNVIVDEIDGFRFQ
jgi:hypothetical protein